MSCVCALPASGSSYPSTCDVQKYSSHTHSSFTVSSMLCCYPEDGDIQDARRRLSNSGSDSSDLPPELPPRTPSRTFPAASIASTQISHTQDPGHQKNTT